MEKGQLGEEVEAKLVHFGGFLEGGDHRSLPELDLDGKYFGELRGVAKWIKIEATKSRKK